MNLFEEFFGKPGRPKYQFNREEIESLIQEFRTSGMQGLREMGEREQSGAARQLSASGIAPSMSIQRAMSTPIMERMAGGRAKLEGGLAQAEGGFKQRAADVQYSGDLQRSMAQYQEMMNFWSGLMDMAGTAGTSALSAGMGGGGGGGGMPGMGGGGSGMPGMDGGAGAGAGAGGYGSGAMGGQQDILQWLNSLGLSF